MANTSGEKELKTDWPHEEGLVLGTTKIKGKEINLIPTNGSLVSKKQKIGFT